MNNYRIWQIDFLRGIAVLSMILFNYSFTLKFFNLINYNSIFYWFFVPRFIAAMFIFISGVSSYLSIKRNKNFFHTFKRGVKIFTIGILITLITYFLFKEHFILFGILHLIGISIVLSYFFFKFEKFNFIFGFIILFIGVFFNFSNQYLFWLFPQKISSFDYEPLFPWFGIFLLGMGSGKFVYYNFKPKNAEKMFNKICFLGRNSLFIYLIHQPVLVFFLFIFHLI
ncbi:MAG: DUF1624 domain-containing protein [Candidatus Aenigmarchaeota archaeon]|nr:DUF1624 domain-containing protein [Candidatus Aenigmarchaeota archaeon]